MTEPGHPPRSLWNFAETAFRSSRPMRFVIVGGCNTVACYVVYAALIWTGLVFWAANLGALLFGIAVSFITQGRIVFGNRDPRRFGRFLGSWLVIYIVQTGAIGLLIRSGMSATLAGLIVLPVAAISSYVIQKVVVFHSSELAR
jgi:putative flippase GtrA